MVKEIVSLFSGCGGLDLGFSQAGFKVVWANEYDKRIWITHEKNYPNIFLDKRDVRNIRSSEIPECVGIIGGPPCQSWSEAGTQKGMNDARGQLFLEYVRILKDKQPLFFLAENVSGMLHKKHIAALGSIIRSFEDANYIVSHKLLNTVKYGVPQDRARVIFVGYHRSLGRHFNFDVLETYSYRACSLYDAIWDLRDLAISAKEKNKTNGELCQVPNHEYMIGGFSSHYLSRNRVRSWDEPSFTIQAGGRHAPMHPQANKMIYVERDKFMFDPDSLHPYRRLSIRECARIQTFPDDIIFYYNDLADAYKMIGNAVPVKFGYALAQAINDDLFERKEQDSDIRVLSNKVFQLSLNI
ncbi:DNA cytosine methyltransferase [Myxacorys almedinensis]|uniref:DNA (cytosine-5-)-methyltransferase n=1 Tax=Myxacorys almedinensis A TaxID=2690445 RepID=A0A8J7Z4I4_9CYAN|nr:DNA cytosine methyltransferase [Myxacorys almedinensis]NDJ17726.1 DNA (cytosine-5-)-methyltransferase [Myxacorys almedinensis A]